MKKIILKALIIVIPVSWIIGIFVFVVLSTDNSYNRERAASQVAELKKEALQQGAEGPAYAQLLDYTREGFHSRRSHAVWAIGELAWDAPFNSDPRIFNKEAIELLEELLFDDDSVMRREAALALIKFGADAEPATEGLIRAVFYRFEVGKVEYTSKYAAEALGNLSSSRVEAALNNAKVTEPGWIADEARRSLEKIKERRQQQHNEK